MDEEKQGHCIPKGEPRKKEYRRKNLQLTLAAMKAQDQVGSSSSCGGHFGKDSWTQAGKSLGVNPAQNGKATGGLSSSEASDGSLKSERVHRGTTTHSQNWKRPI